MRAPGGLDCGAEGMSGEERKYQSSEGGPRYLILHQDGVPSVSGVGEKETVEAPPS